MNPSLFKSTVLASAIALSLSAQAEQPQVGVSPWGPEDELGQLNLMTAKSRSSILAQVDGSAVYDLSVEYFIGMPSWHAAGDPKYQFWMTHTPRGTVVDDPMQVGDEKNRHVSYTGSAFSMYAHMGTHIDALNHFGLDGKIWNGFRADEFLGDRGWQRTGVETIPPIIARGVLIDVAAAKGVEMLPPGYRITAEDLEQTLQIQHSELNPGDVALIRTGRMAWLEDAQRFTDNPPGLGMDAARFLAEDKQVLSVGADNLSFEAFPSEVEGNYVPVHTYLLAQRGITIMELVYLEELASAAVYEFAFIGTPLKIRGGDAAPLRPIALPLRP